MGLFGAYDSSDEFRTVFYGYDTTGGLTINNTQQEVPIDTEVIKDSIYTHSTVTNNGQVTLTVAGTYKITGEVSIETTDALAGVRGAPELRTQVNTGGGFADIAGAVAQEYIREDAASPLSASLSVTIMLAASANDIVRLVVQDLVAAEPTESLVADASRLLIEYLRP
jgi:hypothetical protein